MYLKRTTYAIKALCSRRIINKVRNNFLFYYFFLERYEVVQYSNKKLDVKNSEVGVSWILNFF